MPSLALADDQDDAFNGLTQDELVDAAEVEGIIRDVVAATIGEAPFQHAKMTPWVEAITEGCMKRLVALAKPFKFVVTTNVSQKAGAGLHAAAAMRNNEHTDGLASVRWENDTSLVLTTIYWVAV